MEKYDDLYSEINNLLALLRGCDVVDLVRAHYAKYGNDAPPTLLTLYMEKLQKRLDESDNVAPS